MVPAPDHPVVAGAGDDPWRVDVVGVDVVDGGAGVGDGQGPDRVGGDRAVCVGAELDIDRGGGADGLEAEVDPSVAVYCLIHGLDGRTVGVGPGEGVLGVAGAGGLGVPSCLEEVFAGAGQGELPGEVAGGCPGGVDLVAAALGGGVICRRPGAGYGDFGGVAVVHGDGAGWGWRQALGEDSDGQHGRLG